MLALPMVARAADGPANLVLKGELTRSDHQTYRRLGFTVPPGVTRLTIAFDYDRRDRSTVDIGLFDPQRFRGWSGSNKVEITLAREDATPSYLPGPIPAGRWTLLLGVPNLRKDVATAWQARVWFTRGSERPAVSTFSAAPLKAGLAWFRGDLHMHTAHSDGVCPGQGGVRAPCPLYRTVEAAAAAGLDFIAITDHNTTSHFSEMRGLQPAFPALLLIPGREITTFQGHANVFGPTAFLDFRLGDAALPNANALLAKVAAAGGLLSVNHPALPSGEDCMGCGWTAKGLDWTRVGAIEVANGGAERVLGGEEGPLSGVPFWQARLSEGARITGVGGSDNHDASLPLDTYSAVGRPTTVVEAVNLSERAILDGIRRGRVFIDLDGPKPRVLDLEAKTASASARMGGLLPAAAGESVSLFILVSGVEAGVIEVIEDGKVIAGPPDASLTGGGAVVRPFSLTADGKRHWVRVNVRDPRGRLMLIGNPVYLSAPSASGRGSPRRP